MMRSDENGFHGCCDAVLGPTRPDLHEVPAGRIHVSTAYRYLSYRFTPHEHPYASVLVRRLIEGSVSGLQAADTDYRRKPGGGYELLPDGRHRPVLYQESFTERYGPALSPLLPRRLPGVSVEQPLPVKDLDFSSGGSYAVYNWELFFHVPLAIAIHLSRHQCYEEAQRWFHFIFDPTDDSDDPAPERFWRVRPFQSTDAKSIEKILVNLSTRADVGLWEETVRCIQAWKDAPFRPHLIARYRPSAYMLGTVMAYLDNLIAWGDSLFRQDTGESINEATQLYVLAASILGPRPQAIPKRGDLRPRTYASLKRELDELGDALVELEAEIPFDLAPHPAPAGDPDPLAALSSVGRAHYFGVPRNDKLLGYWDTVADRLFKIRNSLNLQGVFRQLPFFEPPIDPALLARGVAAGLDLGAVVSGANQPLPPCRFPFLVQKAAEICNEVKALGASLLSTMEKEDSEALSVLRAQHEGAILGMTEVVKYSQWQDAIKAREGVEKACAGAFARYTYYERLLGRTEVKAEEFPALDPSELQKLRASFCPKEPELSPQPIEIDIADDLDSADGRKISSYEQEELVSLDFAQGFQDTAVGLDTIAEVLRLLPEFGGNVEPFGVGLTVNFGGQALADNLRVAATVARGVSAGFSHKANRAAKVGAYARREQEWAFQSNLAAAEINQIFKQLRAAEIREAIALWEWKNHQKQIRQAEEIQRFLCGEEIAIGGRKHKKTSTQSLYTWMKRELRGLYSQCFQFAFDVAKKAERALQHELGDPRLTFLQFGYQSGKEGLLAGERLALDLKRMELAFHDLRGREYELQKHVSLQQVAPLELLRLRATGRCSVVLPEALFDLDGPGHYFRRIRSVALSIPCVIGPYASVSCRLGLRRSTIRRRSNLCEGSYARAGVEDDRFVDHLASLEAVVTSTAQHDGGLFDGGAHDERYLPFEGAGAVSEWQLELPGGPRQFDYNTISDVILHLRYTAREGGDLLKSKAIENLETGLKTAPDEAAFVGGRRLLSVRHDFSNDWARFTSATLGPSAPLARLELTLKREHFPFWSRGKAIALTRLELWARGGKAKVDVFGQAGGGDLKDSLRKDRAMGDLRHGRLEKVPIPVEIDAPTPLLLFLDDNSMDDLWLLIGWIPR